MSVHTKLQAAAKHHALQELQAELITVLAALLIPGACAEARAKFASCRSHQAAE